MFVQIIIAMIVAIVWFALDPLAKGNLQIGDLVAFIEYSFHASFLFLIFANLFTMYPKMAVSSSRIQEVLDMPISISPNEDGITQTETRGYLEFDNVTFAIPGETESPVLHNISFKTKPGETIAFIGSTGSGKSSLVNLIPRFYDVTLGKILVDGVDVRDYNLKALRQKVVLSLKKLFFSLELSRKISSTVSKMPLFPNWIERQMLRKLRNLSKVVRKVMQTHLAEGGSNLSGGQKQRLSSREQSSRNQIFISSMIPFQL